MSVLIKGMKMPESCSRCELVGDGSDAVFSWSCPFVGEIYKIGRLTKGRLDDCPLVEIPTPHGRLIDSDALIDELEYDIELEARYLDNFDGTHTERITSEVNKKIFETAIEILQKAPTIIEAEGEE